MGCDIHFHTEIKVNGQWLHYGHPQINRHYGLFYLLAGVRGRGELDEPICISEPKGMPNDASQMTQIEFDFWREDHHSASYLTSKEIDRFYELVVSEKITKSGSFIESTHDSIYGLGIGYLFGNSWKSNNREDWPKCVEDVRWVFWFDN